MLFVAPPVNTIPRRVMMPVEELEPNLCGTTTDSDTPALAFFSKGVRDTIDFGIDFTDWLKANYYSKIKTAAWAAGGDTPQAPTIAQQLFSPVNEAIVVLSGGAVDDIYFLDCTVTFMVTQPTGQNDAVLPERIMVRRIHVKVVDR